MKTNIFKYVLEKDFSQNIGMQFSTDYHLSHLLLNCSTLLMPLVLKKIDFEQHRGFQV